MNIYQKYKDSMFLSFGVTVLCFLGTWLLFGFFWGWIDDTFMINYLRGVFYDGPSDDLFSRYHIILSKLYLMGYSRNVDFPWYEMFQYGGLFIACNFILESFRMISARVGFGTWMSVAGMLVFFVVFLMEAVMLMTFTHVASLLFGASLIIFLLYRTEKKKFYHYLFLIAASWGFLIRPEVTLLTLPVLVFGFLLIKKNPHTIAYIGGILLLLPFSYWIGNINFDKDNKDLEEYHFLIQNILDGHNATDFNHLMEVDEVRTLSLFSWFTGDVKGMLQQPYMDELSMHQPISLASLKMGKEKIRGEYYKSCCLYPEYYASWRNWSKRGVIALILSLVLGIVFCVLSVNRFERIVHLIIPAAFITGILLVTIFFKMEYRVFYPAMIICILFQLTLASETVDAKRLKPSLMAFLGICLVMVPFRLSSFEIASSELDAENDAKHQVIDEINHKFEGKIILFDLWTMSLFHPEPFNQHFLNKERNTLVCYGEIFSNMLEKHKLYLQQLCGEHEIVPFFDCLYQKREDVVFAITEIRKDVLERYFKEVLDRDLNLKELDPADETNLFNVEYSFIWETLHMDYYIFDDSFGDTSTPIEIMPSNNDR